jgi:hypothetical protein
MMKRFYLGLTIALAIILSMPIQAADKKNDDDNELIVEEEVDTNEQALTVSVLYYPVQGLPVGHFKLEVDGETIGWMNTVGKTRPLEELIAKATTKGKSFYRFKIHMDQKSIAKLKAHFKDKPAYTCTRGALDPIGEYGGPKIPWIFKCTPVLSAAYLTGAYYCTTGVVDDVELYQRNSRLTNRSLFRGIFTEVSILINCYFISFFLYNYYW